MTRFGELQGDFVLVVVGLVVAAHPDEDGYLVVGEAGGVLLHGVGMDKHLQATILTQVEVGILVDRL